MAVVAVSISEAVNRRTAPLVEASIQAYGSDNIRYRNTITWG